MQLTINGQEQKIVSGLNVSELLKELDISSPHFAVAVNFQIVPKSQYDSLALNDGDKVEIVHAVGGGSRQRPASVTLDPTKQVFSRGR